MTMLHRLALLASLLIPAAALAETGGFAVTSDVPEAIGPAHTIRKGPIVNSYCWTDTEKWAEEGDTCHLPFEQRKPVVCLHQGQAGIWLIDPMRCTFPQAWKDHRISGGK